MPNQHVNCCGFSGTIMTEQHQNLVFKHRERQIVDCSELPELLGQVLND